MFKKATKSQAKLRAALFGPSGSGKTMTSLRVASGLGGPIAVIDSERGSASKYADRFEFDVCDLTDKSIRSYVDAIEGAAKAGYNVLVIDSLTHAWQELLEQVDQLAKAKYRGNTWSAWSDGTPKQRKLVDAILNYPGHVLATMRSKTEWQTGESKNGKSQPIRVGLAPEQGKGIEYEFDLLLEINPDHQASIIKDRTGKFQDVIVDRPGEEFGKELAAWLSDAPPAERPKPVAQADPQPAPPAGPNGATWGDLATVLCDQANAAWLDEMNLHEVQPRIRGEYKELVNKFQLTNHICKHALEKGAIKLEDIADPEVGRDGEATWVPGKVWAEVGRLYSKIPVKVRQNAEAYIAEKRLEFCRDVDIPTTPAALAPAN